MSTHARDLHRDAVVADTHNDLILLVDHFDKREQRTHFADFWLPELRAGGVDVQVLPICLEEEFQSEGGLRRTLLLIERIHELAAEHASDVALCLTGDDVEAATAAGKIALIIALEGAHGIGQDPKLLRTMWRAGVRVASIAHWGRTFLADGSGLDDTSRSRLTPQGVEVFQEMEQLGVVFDISHLGLAVRRAAVVEPARRVAAPAAVDDEAVADVEQEGVARLRRRPALAGVCPVDDGAAVVRHDVARGEVRRCEEPAPVHRRPPHRRPSPALRAAISCAGHRCPSSWCQAAPGDVPFCLSTKPGGG
jgi:hypothetical protein